MNPTILIVDDEPLVRWSLRRHLESEGFVVVEAETGDEAVVAFGQGVDLVFLDIYLPDASGIDVLEKLRRLDANPPVILITANSTVEGAVAAMKRGAFHYVTKPFDLTDVTVLANRALEQSQLVRQVRHLRASDSEPRLAQIIGESGIMRQQKSLIARIARSRASTVLLCGESGTGKDLVAHAIHDHSERERGPFVNITCTALTETLLESELFGYERGAFTDAKHLKKGLLEQADGGTVFLDEVGETNVSFQAKLLRFLEEKAFRRVGGTADVRPDVRVIAATNRDLAQAVEKGRFREDLYYRLAVAKLELPPLRERDDDIALLAAAFIEQFNNSLHRRILGISPAAQRLLRAHTWPGNVRELRNVIERAMLFADEEVLRPADFSTLEAERNVPSGFRLPATGVDFNEVERSLVLQALQASNGNQTRAASLLGMNRDQIRYRMHKFGLAPKRSGKKNRSQRQREARLSSLERANAGSPLRATTSQTSG